MQIKYGVSNDVRYSQENSPGVFNAEKVASVIIPAFLSV